MQLNDGTCEVADRAWLNAQSPQLCLPKHPVRQAGSRQLALVTRAGDSTG
jgi:hypothetical protein